MEEYDIFWERENKNAGRPTRRERTGLVPRHLCGQGEMNKSKLAELDEKIKRVSLNLEMVQKIEKEIKVLKLEKKSVLAARCKGCDEPVKVELMPFLRICPCANSSCDMCQI